MDIDLANYVVTAQSGVSLEELAHALQKEQVYSWLPATQDTLGGAFCSGCFPEFYATVIGIQVLLADGSLARYGGKLTKNAAGYNLIRLFAGSQGSLGIVTELTFKIFANKQSSLVPQPWRPLTRNVLWQRLKKTLDPQNTFCTPKEEA